MFDKRMRSLAACLLLAALCFLPGCNSKKEKILRTAQDAANARIGVMTGSVGEALAKAKYPRADVQTFDDIMNAVAALQSGKLDAVLTTFPTAQQVAKKNADLWVLPEHLDQEETSVALRKEDTALRADVDRIIADLRAEGALDDMSRRWLKSDLSPYEVPAIPLPTQGKPIVVGVSATREPLTFVDANGEVSGHDGELARRIAARLHRPLRFENMKFLALIPALKSGKIDMVITGMTATPERRKSVDFSISYFTNAQVLLARRPADVQAAAPPSAANPLAALNKGKIAVLTGSAGDLAARKHFPQASFQDMNSPADAALAVRTHKVDAFVYDKSVLLNLVEKDPSLTILPTPVDKLGLAAALNKNNAVLLGQLNQQIAALAAEGKLKALRDKWVDSHYKTPPATPLAAPASGPVLRMGTCSSLEPFSFHTNAGLSGLDIELGRLLAQRLGRRLEILDMNFEALIPALQSGKIDFALSNFNVTEERKKLIHFTTPYLENDISALTARSAAAATSPAKEAASGKLSSAADLKDKRIATLLGSAHSAYVVKHYPQARLQEYKSAADLIVAVKSHKADAGLYDSESLRAILHQEPGLGVLNDNLFSFEVGVGFNKHNTELRAQFDSFLAESKRNGVHAEMVKRWMEQGQTQMPAIAEPKGGKPLTIAVSDVGLPFVAVKDNRLTGFDIELVTRFASSIGRPVRFADMDFGSLVASVASGKADMLVSSVFITEERQKQIDFSAPYYAMETRAFALKENLAASAPQPAPVQNADAKLSSMDDLKDKKLGVMLGSVHDAYVAKNFPQATVLQYKSPPDLVVAVRTGKVDAAFYTTEVLQEVLKNYPDLAILADRLENYPIATGFRKGNPALREQFNAFLASIKKDGVYAGMTQRWMKAHDESMPAIPNSGKNGKIVIGYVSDKGMPFTILRNNQPIGYDVELAERFGAYLGKQVVFSDMDFGSLIAALSAGKVDMIVSTLVITDERKTRIDFSDPYYELGSCAFVLKNRLASSAPPATTAKEPTILQSLAESFYSNIVMEKRYLLLLDGLQTTILISILSAIFGTLLGALVCFLRMSKRAAFNVPAKIYIAILRGIPVLVLLMVIFYVVFASVSISPVLVAVVAFGMNFAAYAAEIFRTGIQSIDRGQREAGLAMGFTPLQTFLYIILPQTVQRILPVYKGEFISMVKMTSIVGYIAVQDLTKASDIIRSRTFDAFFPLIIVAILYFLIAWVLTQALERLEQMTNSKNRRKGAQA